VCGCTPTTCLAEGKNCGSISDGCGRTLNCGTCQGRQFCGGGGEDNVCGGCTPDTSCAEEAWKCGTLNTGCAMVSCGTCDDPEQCGPNHTCICIPLEKCPAGFECGTVPDGCGGTLTCGGSCNDNIDCTVDSCNNGHKCQHKADDAKCADENACTLDSCDDQAGCMNTLMCSADVCDPLVGCP
jgi:hypothetical protein